VTGVQTCALQILIIDDLIATGGTAEAAAKLIEISGGTVASFIFVINLFGVQTAKINY
jgi:adenine phosphoribosyltransferase